MINNILKNIIFIPVLGIILVNSNLRTEEIEDLTVTLEQNLTELEKLETIQNDQEKTQQNKSQYFKGLNLNKETLLQNDDKKEIRRIEPAKMNEKAELVFDILEDSKNNYRKITEEGNKKTETQDQNGMKSDFDKIDNIIIGNNKPLNADINKKFRQFLYLSLDWDEKLLNKFKDKLHLMIQLELIRTAKNMAIFAINIQTKSEETFKTIFLNNQIKNKLYKKDTKDLETIKNNVNEIMTLRKQWKDIINSEDSLLSTDMYKKAEKIYRKITGIKTATERILK